MKQSSTHTALGRRGSCQYKNRPSAGAAPAETSRAHAEAALAVTNLALGQRGSCRINIGLADSETAPAATNPAPGRSGSCRNESGPRPKRLLPKRYRPPAEAAPAEALPAPPKRLLPNSHSSRAGQIPPFRVARSRTGKVPTVGLQSGADLRGARGDSLVSERAGREGESCSWGTAGQKPHAQTATGQRVF